VSPGCTLPTDMSDFTDRIKELASRISAAKEFL
jgi:hypothetical protein